MSRLCWSWSKRERKSRLHALKSLRRIVSSSRRRHRKRLIRGSVCGSRVDNGEVWSWVGCRRRVDGVQVDSVRRSRALNSKRLCIGRSVNTSLMFPRAKNVRSEKTVNKVLSQANVTLAIDITIIELRLGVVQCVRWLTLAVDWRIVIDL